MENEELTEFERGLLESLEQAKRGEFAAVHTPEQIMVRRRGRPIGSVQEVTKEPVKIRLDADLLAALRATGDGWQTRIHNPARWPSVPGAPIAARPACGQGRRGAGSGPACLRHPAPHRTGATFHRGS